MKHTSFIFLALLGFVVGCGSGQTGVQGTVVFSDDGEPLTRGTIIFTTPTFQASSSIDEQGRFTMGSYSDADGVPPGTYKVSISGVFLDLDDTGLNTYSLIDPKFTSTATSGIEITVDKSAIKDLVIKVDRNPHPIPGRR